MSNSNLVRIDIYRHTNELDQFRNICMLIKLPLLCDNCYICNS